MKAEEDTEIEAFQITPSFSFLPDKFKGDLERPPLQPKVRDIFPQIISSCIAHMLVIHAGINMAFSAILLPQLTADDFKITLNEASWIASLMAIATPVGALVCGPLMDLCGRKLFSLFVCIPIGLAWLLMGLTPNNVWPIYLSRILAGFGGGLTTVSLVYISEISAASWRPMLLCLNSVFVSLGILLTNALGVCLPWRMVALCAAALVIATAAAIAGYTPESPYWLLTFHPESTKHLERAKESLRFLYPNREMYASEWERLKSVSQQKQKEIRERSEPQGMLKEFTDRSSLLPLSLLVVLFLLQQLSGTYPIIFYAVPVFQKCMGNAHFAWLNPDSATVLLGAFRFVMSVLTAALSRTFGRRTLMIVSTVGMTVSTFAAALYFHKTYSIENHSFASNSSINATAETDKISLSVERSEDFSKFIGVVCILIFVIMSSVGMLIIPWTLIGELLPMRIRGTGGGCLISFAYLLMFGTVKVFPVLMNEIDVHGLFYSFSVVSLISVIVVYFFLPETLGKNFEEIEKSFKK